MTDRPPRFLPAASFAMLLASSCILPARASFLDAGCFRVYNELDEPITAEFGVGFFNTDVCPTTICWHYTVPPRDMGEYCPNPLILPNPEWLPGSQYKGFNLYFWLGDGWRFLRDKPNKHFYGTMTGKNRNFQCNIIFRKNEIALAGCDQVSLEAH